MLAMLAVGAGADGAVGAVGAKLKLEAVSSLIGSPVIGADAVSVSWLSPLSPLWSSEESCLPLNSSELRVLLMNSDGGPPRPD